MVSPSLSPIRLRRSTTAGRSSSVDRDFRHWLCRCKLTGKSLHGAKTDFYAAIGNLQPVESLALGVLDL